MTKHERIQAAIARRPVDRVPYAVWCHFPEVDRSTAGLAQATLRFHQRYGSDFLKVTPAAGYAVADWGCVESDTVLPDGHRPCASHAVNAAADWKKIKPLDITTTAYGQHLESIVRVVVDRRADAPVVPTMFSPLSLARKLSGDRLNQDLRERPEAVVAALEAITDTLIRFLTLCLDEEAAGIFYSIQAASRRFHTAGEYARFGEPYDRRILEVTMARARLVIVHAHGDELMFDQLSALPGHAWNWDDRSAGPSLRGGKAKVTGAVIGGANQSATLHDGTPEDVRAEVMDAVDQTDGIGLIVGPGCVLPPGVPDENVTALVRALGGTVGMDL
ncbi:MAG: uroporphyrinogen decarboxylase [Candidatus Rokubacteria bacterium]|nr:uroporphyrinogen decarboxylase [Candidatus Rokubacteria bacterium]